MTEPTENTPPARPAASLSGRLALLIAIIALAASAAQWLGLAGNKAFERTRGEDLARVQRRLSSLDERIQRERENLTRLAEKIGGTSPTADSLTGRVIKLEEVLTRTLGGENARFLWVVEQAEYFLRSANAQENLAGNSAGALTALQFADDRLRDAADPRLSPVRKLLAGEIATLRALPRVDTEGMTLKLAGLESALPQLPRRQAAPARFSPEPAAPPADASGLERARQALRNAFLSIVSVRRTDEPTATLLTDEASSLLAQSLAMELQMARLALLRGDAHAFRAAVAAAQRDIEKYFDTAAPPVADALAVLNELAGVNMPKALPDISASLVELLRIKERESRS